MSSNKFCLSKNSPSPLRTPSPSPPSPSSPSSITTIKERKGSNKQEWSDDEITQLINLWKQEEALYNSKCHNFSNSDEWDKALERIIANVVEECREATIVSITEA